MSKKLEREADNSDPRLPLKDGSVQILAVAVTDDRVTHTHVRPQAVEFPYLWGPVVGDAVRAIAKSMEIEHDGRRVSAAEVYQMLVQVIRLDLARGLEPD